MNGSGQTDTGSLSSIESTALLLAGEEAEPLVVSRHDDRCLLCRGGGELLCCNACPCAFHHACLGLPARPLGAWLCAVCRDDS